MCVGCSRGMRMIIPMIVHIAVVAGILLGVVADRAAALVLITAQEAALPDANGIVIGWRGLTRGPRVVVVYPAPDAGSVQSPLQLLLRFEGHGGAGIDLSSVKMIYLKNPTINLTQRIGDWIMASGIDLRSAEVPPGTHYLKVEIKDTAGRPASATFELMGLK